MDINFLKESLECSICQEVFKEPKQLSCGHTFCEECLKKMLVSREVITDPRMGTPLNRISCPECRSVSYTTLSSLKTNYNIKRVVERLNDGDKGKGKQVKECSACSEKVEAIKMFICYCNRKAGGDQYLCAYCALSEHNGHKLKAYPELRLERIREKARKEVVTEMAEYMELKENVRKAINLASTKFGAVLENILQKEEFVRTILDSINKKAITPSEKDIAIEVQRLNHFMDRMRKLFTHVEKVGWYSSKLEQYCAHFLSIPKNIQLEEGNEEDKAFKALLTLTRAEATVARKRGTIEVENDCEVQGTSFGQNKRRKIEMSTRWALKRCETISSPAAARRASPSLSPNSVRIHSPQSVSSISSPSDGEESTSSSSTYSSSSSSSTASSANLFLIDEN